MVGRLPILIVEDDEILALNMVAAVEDRDCLAIGPVATVADALAKLGSQDIGGAILDAALIDRDVTPVAMELIDRAIPFVIHTGVGLPAELETVFPHVSVIMKPADPDEVIVQLLAQVKALQGGRADGSSSTDPLSVAGAQRCRQVDRVASALFDQFGVKAIVLARRQAAAGNGEVLAVWLDIIELLRKKERE
jgi:DNA-binding NtrC family response regulator